MMLIQFHWSPLANLEIWLGSFAILFELLPEVHKVFKLIEENKAKVKEKKESLKSKKKKRSFDK